MRLPSTSSRVRASGASRSISSSNVRLESSIIAHSSPSTSTEIRRGSLPSSSSPSEFASLRAGSIVTTTTRSPRSAIPRATAAAVVVLPTPPEPAQITIRLPSSSDVSMRTSRAASDQTFADRERDRLGAAASVQLGHHVVKDVLHVALRIGELLGALARRVPGRDQGEHLLLAVGQPPRDGPRPGAVL